MVEKESDARGKEKGMNGREKDRQILIIDGCGSKSVKFAYLPEFSTG